MLSIMESAIKFNDQATKYLAQIETRKRRPARANTLAIYRSLLNSRVLPILGELNLSEVDNAAVKLLAGRLAEARLSPATINLAVTLVKQIVKSAVDANGNALYPRVWNPDFIDAPVIVRSEQKAPITPSKAISQAISRASGEVKALIGLLAGSGLRIGEALALSTTDDGRSNWWDPARGTVRVRATIARGKLQPAPKTDAGDRVIDLDPALNNFLRETLNGVIGQVFTASDDTYYRQLKALGIEGGFHGFRRFRETYLESIGVPRMLMKFWTGHASEDITERYIKFGPQVEERKQKAAQAGLGFAL